MGLTIKIEGIGACMGALKRRNTQMGAAFGRALKQGAQIILDDAQARCPVDTGALQASGVQFAVLAGWRSIAFVGFGEPVRGYFKGNREKHPEEYAVYRYDYENADYEERWLEVACDNSTPALLQLCIAEMSK